MLRCLSNSLQLARVGVSAQAGLVAIAVCLAVGLSLPSAAVGQGLLKGEFGNIQLGRELIEPTRFPTIRELREMVSKPEMTAVLMFKLYGDEHNHHVPVWSPDGERLAFQRTTRGSDASKLLAFTRLSSEEPLLISSAPDAYDLMFRWGMNNPRSFVFSRINAGRQSTQVCYSADGTSIETRTTEGHGLYPSLFERTDGVRWLAYERDGQVYQQAWKDSETQEQPLVRGTSPTWSRDGKRLLMARDVGGNDKLASYRVVVRTLGKSGNETELPAASGGFVRSPTWSPDETQAACYVREAGDNTPWRIMVSSTTGDGGSRMVGEDVVVNPSFRSEGPSWDQTGKRIWFFSQKERKQEYFPLVAADVKSGQLTTVNYATRCTTPFDVAVNPVTRVPEFAFVAHVGVAQDLFILFLNHD
jgi:hypothetical protein